MMPRNQAKLATLAEDQIRSHYRDESAHAVRVNAIGPLAISISMRLSRSSVAVPFVAIGLRDLSGVSTYRLIGA